MGYYVSSSIVFIIIIDSLVILLSLFRSGSNLWDGSPFELITKLTKGGCSLVAIQRSHWKYLAADGSTVAGVPLSFKCACVYSMQPAAEPM